MKCIKSLQYNLCAYLIPFAINYFKNGSNMEWQEAQIY